MGGGGSYYSPSRRSSSSRRYSSRKNSGCYVATCVYGSYDCPQVWTLRRYRDFHLAKSLVGRMFVRIYYTISPFFVRCFGKKRWFKKICRQFLDKMILSLKNKGYKDSPYQDRTW